MSTSDPNPAPPPPEIIDGTATLTAITGLTFVISETSGDIVPGPQGLIVRDTRHLSRLVLTVDGLTPPSLGAGVIAADALVFRSYTDRLGHLDPPLELERRRTVLPDGLYEEFIVYWWAPEPASVDIGLSIDCDFADIFEVRRLGAARFEHRAMRREDSPWKVTFDDGEGGRRTVIRFSAAASRQAEGTHVWRPTLSHGTPWRLQLRVAAASRAQSRPIRLGARSADPPVRVETVPSVLGDACRRSVTDLNRLSLADPLDPARRIITAGIPWFVALFGRDSLIASYQARAFTPSRMGHTLLALAARQGQIHDPANEEQPGKILHEVRLNDNPWLGTGTTGGVRPYYGSIDATPLFLVLLGTAWRWGLDRATLDALLPSARRAAEWLRTWGDPDGDGFLEYAPTGERTLANQGWKDSANAIQHPDGSLAHGAIAVVEAQGYAYRGRRELAAILTWLGHDNEAADLNAEADELRRAICERFWSPGTATTPGFFALALDGDKQQVASIASNMGHLLWCGVPTNEQAEQVAEHLAGPALSSGWGLRTLSDDMAGYNPISYHAGSVWPHDTAIAIDGLRRYGLEHAALSLTQDLIDACEIFELMLPELFGGHRRDRRSIPVPYAAACRPQAWAAGVPLCLIPVLLGLEPLIPDGTISLNPILPDAMDLISVRGLPFPSGPLSVAISREDSRIIALPPGVRIEFTARPS